MEDNEETLELSALDKIRRDLKAPKNQTNDYGGYDYRSCEDILEALKPLLFKHGAFLSLDDDLINIGERFYVKTTANVIDLVHGGEWASTGWAREAQTQPKKSEDQVTLSASSYAQKSALNKLFLIDDSRETEGGEDVETITKEQAKEIEGLLETTGRDKAKFLQWGGCDKVENLPLAKYKQAIAILKEKGKS